MQGPHTTFHPDFDVHHRQQQMQREQALREQLAREQQQRQLLEAAALKGLSPADLERLLRAQQREQQLAAQGPAGYTSQVCGQTV